MKTIEDHRAKSVQAGEINVSKIGKYFLIQA